MKNIVLKIILILIIMVICPLNSIAKDLFVKAKKPAVVEINGEKLMKLKASYRAIKIEDRANTTEENIVNAAKDLSINPKKYTIDTGKDASAIFIDDMYIMTVSELDAKLEKKTKEEYSKELAVKISKFIQNYREARTPKAYLKGGLKALITTMVFLLLIKLTSLFSSKFYTRFESWKKYIEKPIMVGKTELFTPTSIISFITGIIRFIRNVFLLFLTYIYFAVIFSCFPHTKGLESKLLGNLIETFKEIFAGIVDYLPKLTFIVIILLFAFYFNKFVKIFFNEIKNKNIKIRGFYTEWAGPTCKIARFFVLALALALIFPFLPGANTQAFKGVSIFVGALFSLGSTVAISNIIAGIVLTYTRAFQIGDVVKITDYIGRIVETTLLVTRINTPKNEIISLPNNKVLNADIINYSKTAARKGLILYTTVGIGYDAPWQKVHELLIEAALKTENIEKKPMPFVFQKELRGNDILYELNAYTNEAAKMMATYSQLHQNIQDAFNEAGVEIMTPYKVALRDSNKMDLPDNYLPNDYEGWSFKFKNV